MRKPQDLKAVPLRLEFDGASARVTMQRGPTWRPEDGLVSRNDSAPATSMAKGPKSFWVRPTSPWSRCSFGRRHRTVGMRGPATSRVSSSFICGVCHARQLRSSGAACSRRSHRATDLRRSRAESEVWALESWIAARQVSTVRSATTWSSRRAFRPISKTSSSTWLPPRRRTGWRDIRVR